VRVEETRQFGERRAVRQKGGLQSQPSLCETNTPGEIIKNVDSEMKLRVLPK
jgi:hypothetical protein